MAARADRHDHHAPAGAALAVLIIGSLSARSQPEPNWALASVPVAPDGTILAMTSDRDRDDQGRARQARPRDRLGQPLPYGSAGVEPVSEDALPPEETISYAH